MYQPWNLAQPQPVTGVPWTGAGTRRYLSTLTANGMAEDHYFFLLGTMNGLTHRAEIDHSGEKS